MSENIEVREMKIGELEKVVDLHIEGLGRELNLFNQIINCKSVDLSGRSDLKNILYQMFHTGECNLFVAKDDDQLVGYCLATKKIYPVELPKVTGCINGIFIKESHRRKKLGAKLYELAEDWFKREEIEFIELYHMMNDERATAFWQAVGYKAVQYYCGKRLSHENG